jgi:hypothetical protein
MVKAISLRVDIELSWSAASLAASSCSQSLFKALIIRGALKRQMHAKPFQDAKRVFQCWDQVKGTDEARIFLLALLVDVRVKNRS